MRVACTGEQVWQAVCIRGQGWEQARCIEGLAAYRPEHDKPNLRKMTDGFRASYGLHVTCAPPR